jgi:hypothetical protein
MFIIHEILLVLFISVSFIKVLKNLKIKKKHSHLIVEPNVTNIFIIIIFDWAFYDNNISKLLEVCPNLTYYAKTSKFINMFPNIKRTRLQIMNHMKYIYKTHKKFS